MEHKINDFTNGIHVVWKDGMWNVLEGKNLVKITEFVNRFDAYVFAKNLNKVVFVHSKDGKTAFKYVHHGQG